MIIILSIDGRVPTGSHAMLSPFADVSKVVTERKMDAVILRDDLTSIFRRDFPRESSFREKSFEERRTGRDE